MLQLENNKDLNTEQKNLNNIMSRKKRAPKRIFYPDAKYQSLTLAKFINLAKYENLDGHANSVKIRLERESNWQNKKY